MYVPNIGWPEKSPIMKKDIRLVKKYRKYSIDFKKMLVEEFESGRYSVLQLSKLHGVDFKLIYNWIYKFSTFNERGIRVVEMKESSTAKIKALEKRIKELERTVGNKQIMIDYLEKMMEIAKEEYNIDIKKNSDTPRSGGLGKISRK